MKKLFFLFFTFVTITVLHAQTVTTLRIDPDNALGGTVSQIFDSVRFIPLETTQQSTFGQIYQLEVTEKYFIIYDADTNAILIFTRDGKFHAKIKQRTPTEYFGGITLNRGDNEIITDVSGDKVLIYDYNGKLLREEAVPTGVERLFCFDKKTIAYNIARPLKAENNSEKKYDLVYSDGFNHITKKLLPYDPRYTLYEYNLPNVVFSGQGTDGTCFFSFPYNYTVSQLNETGIVHQYKIIFPQKYSLPPNFATDSGFAGKRIDYVFHNHDNDAKFTQVTPFYKENDHLIFHIGKIALTFSYNDDLFYSLKTSNLYSFGRISGDSTTSFIPVLDSHFLENMHSVYNNVLYTSVPSFILFQTKESATKKINYIPVLENLFSKGSKKDNPVIIESRLKNNL